MYKSAHLIKLMLKSYYLFLLIEATEQNLFVDQLSLLSDGKPYKEDANLILIYIFFSRCLC